MSVPLVGRGTRNDGNDSAGVTVVRFVPVMRHPIYLCVLRYTT